MPEQVPKQDMYDEVIQKSAEVLQAISVDGWSNRTAPFAHNAERLLTETTEEKYEETGLWQDGDYTETGAQVREELKDYINSLRSEVTVRMTDGSAEMPGVGKGAVGYRMSFGPEDEQDPFVYAEKAGERIGLLTNKRGDSRRYELFTKLSAGDYVEQSELNDMVDMSRGPISRILGELEEEEVIERYSPAGVNGNVVELTERGEELEEFVSGIENLVAEHTHDF